MNTGVVKLFKKLLILLAIVFVLDRAFGSIIEYLFLNEPLGDAAAFSHAINNPSEEILIYGSSRAVHTYDTKVIQDATGLTAFNCGRNASNIIYHDAILPAALNNPNHKPKAIILDLVAKEIQARGTQGSDDVLASMLIPYVRTNEHFANLSKELFPKEYYKARVSKLYAYNSLILSIARNYSRKENDNVNGYQPLVGSKVKTKPGPFTMGRDGIDEYGKEHFMSFVKSVKEAGVPLFIIFSPAYVDGASFKETQSMKVCKQIAADYGFETWDYSTDPKYVKKELFYDMNHLNTTGADMFTKEICERMIQTGKLK